jgi:hypothetical protein
MTALFRVTSIKAPEMGILPTALVTVPEMEPGDVSKEKSAVVVSPDAMIALIVASSKVAAAAVTV